MPRSAESARREAMQALHGASMQLTARVAESTRTRVNDRRFESDGAFFHPYDQATLGELRRKGRALYRSTLLGRAIVNRVVQLVLGSGYTLSILSESREWNQRIERALEPRLVELNARLRSIVRMMLTDGDVLAVFSKDRIVFIEADRVTHGQGRVDPKSERFLSSGVEMDSLGEPLFYHVASYANGGSMVDTKTTAVDAKDCCLIMEQDWLGQPRGIPRLGSAGDAIYRLEEFQADTALAAAIAAQVAFWTKTSAPDLAGSLLPSPSPSPSPDPSVNVTPGQGVTEPGMFVHLGANEEVGMLRSEQPGPNYESFVHSQLRQIGAAFDLPMEALALDLSQTNFHSARSALLLAQRSCEQWHAALRPFLVRWYTHAVRAVLAVAVDAAADGGDTGDQAALPDNWERHEWIRPAPPVLDPEAMARADIAGLSSLTTTLAEVYGRKGQDWTEALEQLARERDEMKRLGLSTTPLQGAAVGVPGPGVDPDPDPESDADPDAKPDKAKKGTGR